MKEYAAIAGGPVLYILHFYTQIQTLLTYNVLEFTSFANSVPGFLTTKFPAVKLDLMTSTNSARIPLRSSKSPPNTTLPKSCYRSMGPSLLQRLQFPRATRTNRSPFSTNSMSPVPASHRHRLLTFNALLRRHKPQTISRINLLHLLPLLRMPRALRSYHISHLLPPRFPLGKPILHRTLTPAVGNISNNRTGTIAF